MRVLLRRVLLCLTLVSLLLALSAVSLAQEPQAVLTALDALNRETGGNYLLRTSVGFLYREEIFDGDNLGCPGVPNNNPGQIRGYVVQFDTNFDGTYEWEIRVSADSAITVICRRPVVVAPGPTFDPGPAQPTSTPSACSALTPRVAIGGQGRVLPPQPNILRGAPARSGEYLGEIAVGGVFDVLDGPRCAGTLTWWQVRYQGTVGWTAESDGSEYWVEPFLTGAEEEAAVGGPLAVVTPVVCDPALPPRLARFEPARVTPGYANNLRATPSRSGEQVGRIPGGEAFNVLDGPRCGDGLTWWQVDYQGTVGWTVEGMDGSYFLAPPAPATPISASSAPSVATVATIPLPEPPTRVLLTGRAGVDVVSAAGYRKLERVNPLGDGVQDFAYQEINNLTDATTQTVLDALRLPNGQTWLALATPNGVLLGLFATDAPPVVIPVTATSARFDATGTRLLTLEADNTLRVFAIDLTGSGAPARELLTERLTGTPDAAFLPNGLVIAEGSLLTLYTADGSGAYVARMDYQNDLTDQRISAREDGLVVVVGAAFPGDVSTTVRVIDMVNGVLRMGYPGESASFVSRAVFLPDNTFAQLDNAGGFPTVRVNDLESGGIVGAFPAPFVGELVANERRTLIGVVQPGTDIIALLGVIE